MQGAFSQAVQCLPSTRCAHAQELYTNNSETYQHPHNISTARYRVRENKSGPSLACIDKIHVVAIRTGRHLYSAVTGFLLIYYPFGNSAFALLFPSAVTYLAMLRLRQHAATLSWLVTFSFLLYW